MMKFNNLTNIPNAQMSSLGLRVPCLQWNSWWERVSSVQFSKIVPCPSSMHCTVLGSLPVHRKRHLVRNLQHPRGVEIALTLVCRCVNWGSEVISNVLRSQGWSPLKMGSQLISSVDKGYCTMLHCFQLVNEVLCGETQRSAELT